MATTRKVTKFAKFLDFLKNKHILRNKIQGTTPYVTYIFDVAPDGVSLGEAVELGERVDGAQPGVELTELSRNHSNLFSFSFSVVDLDPGGSAYFFCRIRIRLHFNQM